MTITQLKKLSVEWQRVLRLQDWLVKVQYSRNHEMQSISSVGQCHWFIESKEATISILDPADRRPCNWPHDEEQTLVHELLHLHFAPFAAQEDSPAAIAQEQAIDLITWGLINTKRSKGK